MFTKGTKSAGKVKSATMKLTRGRSKTVKQMKPGSSTKGRTKAVTKSSLNSTGTKATGSTRGVKVAKYSTKARNPQVKRPVVKPLQLGGSGGE